ncbi:MAG: HRDC domain-containing protein [Dermatophilaceae bacterium]
MSTHQHEESPASATAGPSLTDESAPTPGTGRRRRTRASRAAVQAEIAQSRRGRTAAPDDAAGAGQEPRQGPSEGPPEGPPGQAAPASPDEGLDAPSAEPLLIAHPREGIPEVIEEEKALAEAASALACGSGPVALDAERASGYRYGQRAYLVQLRRAGTGTLLIDPIACPDLSPISRVLEGVEWVVHAASQDLPCLAEVGLHPQRLFDTELGARLAGQPRVGLATVLEHYLNLTLAKEHSAADWSTRPLPEPWLRYAALDVEVLIELRDAVEADLDAQGKLAWAREEFDALTDFTGPPQRVEPWRRLSGLHKIRSRRTLAVARELWWIRDEIARTRDISPGRIIPDTALVEIAQAAPGSVADVVAATPNRSARRYAVHWLTASKKALAMPESELPSRTLSATGPPPPRVWADRDPIAAHRLARARAAIAGLGQEYRVPVENILAPDVLRRVMWEPPPAALEAVREALAGRGARPWQVEIVAPALVAALAGDDPADSEQEPQDNSDADQ